MERPARYVAERSAPDPGGPRQDRPRAAGRRRRAAGRRAGQDCADPRLCLALSRSRLHRPVLRDCRSGRRTDPGLDRLAKPPRRVQGHCQAHGRECRQHQRHPPRSLRLLRPQLRGRRLLGCGADVCRRGQARARAADARAGSRLGAQGHGPADSRARRPGRAKQCGRL
ncbi:hypothetical protein SDC9_192830 [bioreactor metagenome]|uniref:Uncharacterized protein n=1 Tax=bioreactor metagenome TaxID=1076179 RepID=A0A645ICV5_9ZZZZ